MAFKNNRSRVIVPAIEMTPMIDIIFLLIIFFMVAAQFAREAHVDLNLPSEQGEQDDQGGAHGLLLAKHQGAWIGWRCRHAI